MRYYLDTNILYFALVNKDELCREVNEIVSDCSNLLYTSSVCVMELMQIMQTKPLKGVKLKSQDIFEHLEILGVEIKYVDKRHLEVFSKMPVLHSDPNDRLIIAQSAADDIPLISSDAQFPLYARKMGNFKFVLNRR